MRTLLLAGLLPLMPIQAQSKVQSFTLPNGLRVLHLEDHERPLVRARLHLRLEPSDTPAGRQGLPQLTLRMLRHSDAADLKADELLRLGEDLGLQQAQTVTPDGLDWHLLARSRDQDRALGLLADRLLRSLFEPALLESQRLACWRDESQPDESPRRRLRHTLVQGPAWRPSFSSLGAITWEELLAFRARVVRPDRAILVLHGDLGLEQARRLVLLSLGTWTALEAPAGSVTTGPVPARPAEAGPIRTQASGAGLRIQAVADRPEGLNPAVSALLTLLVPDEPLVQPVRLGAEGGSLVATLDAETGGSMEAARALLLDRIEALRRRGFSQGDLDRAREAWLASRSLDSLHPAAQMEAALAEALGRRATGHQLESLTLEQLNAGLRRWLEASNLRLGGIGEPGPAMGIPTP